MSVSINHHREGEGPPLILLHGIGQHWQAWRPVIPLLAREYEVIACDSPGFGRSAPLSAGIEPTIPAYVDAFEWFFAELGLERPHVAGSSMGGAIALELARRRAVRSACAVSPAGFWSAPERRFCELSLRLVADVPAAIRPALVLLARTGPGRAALCFQMYGYPSRLPAEEAVGALRAAWESPSFKDVIGPLGRYSFQAGHELGATPVTVAWGERDRLLPYRLQAPRARALLPQATHVTLGGGHLPFYDDPAAVAEVVRSSARPVAAAAAHAS